MKKTSETIKEIIQADLPKDYPAKIRRIAMHDTTVFSCMKNREMSGESYELMLEKMVCLLVREKHAYFENLIDATERSVSPIPVIAGSSKTVVRLPFKSRVRLAWRELVGR